MNWAAGVAGGLLSTHPRVAPNRLGKRYGGRVLP